ncbi:MAG: 3'(2'),5'-bisphosphate nucleotidase CysQ [Gammaproteobacteria bacterium]|nr:3'(2'),5'-bisphosphate nucleotidase CysQ [Gammaproteobacteria bacterium]
MIPQNGGPDPGTLIDAVVEIAQLAAAAILQVYEGNFEVRAKDDKSPLTAADMASHELICSRLRELEPRIPVLSEESAAVPFPKRRNWKRYWLVDPLDGTREFIRRNGEFTVNIALIDDHRPVLGVVGVPAQRACFLAWDGGGAFRQAQGGTREPVRTRRASRDRIAAAGSRSHGTEAQKRFFASLGQGAEIIAVGSALKFCLIAEGKADIYPRFGPTCEWDTAAAQCVVEEAGGIVVDFDWKPLAYNTRESFLNPHFIVIGDREFDWRPYLQMA